MTKKKILFIATGGTIASQEKQDGLGPIFKSDELLKFFPEAKKIADISTKQISQLDSTNILPSHWEKIATTIIKNYKNFDGFVVSHGTDTISYTAAALSFVFRRNSKPIVLTGSVLPLSNSASDAKQNLIIVLL